MLRHYRLFSRANRSIWPQCVVAMLMLMTSSVVAQVKVTARAEPSNATIGETIVYSVDVETEGQQQVPQPQLPAFDSSWGFTPPNFGGSSTEFSFRQTNAGMSQQYVIHYHYNFMVTKAGTFTIPETTVRVAGATYKSNPVKINVTKTHATAAQLPAELQGSVAPPQVPNQPQLQNALNGAVFVLPIVETKQPYAGQQVLLGYHLCVDKDALARAGLVLETMHADRVDIPEFQQFIKDEVYPPPKQLQFREREFGGKRYYVAPLYQVAVTPTKTGKLSVQPFRLSMWFVSKNKKGRSSDPFFGDDIFPDDAIFGAMNPFMSANRVQVIASSLPVDFNIRQLPTEDKPANFSGAVGEFKISAQVDRREAKADEDVVKLTVKVEGKGDASALPLPTMSTMKGLQLLEDPKTSTNRRVENDQLVYSKTYDYILRPTEPGALSIPPLSMNVFNPKTEQYGVLETDPIGLDVSPGANKQVALVAPAPPGQSNAQANPTQEGEVTNATPETPNAPQDLRYIHVGTLNAVTPGVLSGQGPLLYVLLATPPLLVLAGTIINRRRSSQDARRGYLREAAAGVVARRHLKSVARLMNSGKPDKFFEELARATRGFFGDKLHLEPTGLTIEQIEEEYRRREASPDDIARVRTLLEQCDSARYSPIKPDQAVMEEAYRSAAEILSKLEKV